MNQAPDRRFFGHPRGLSTLFFTELWERFSYYGMRAILIAFMTAPIAVGGLGFETAKAGGIYGLYTSLVYMVSLPGGWIADRFLGSRKSVLAGGFVIMLGHVSLAIHSLATFYLGLALVVAGTGFLKPNISVMVGHLYGGEDARRDAGFSIFYMGINLGAFLAPLATGWLAQSEEFRGILESVRLRPENAWQFGFGAAAVGMFFGLLQYARGGRHLGEAGPRPPQPADAPTWRRLGYGLGSAAALVLALVALGASGAVRVTVEGIADAFGYALLLLVVVFFLWLFLSRGWTRGERRRLLVIAVLFAASSVFWSVFEQAGSTLNLFAIRSANTTVLGWTFPPAWFQSVNALLIIALAPVFAWIWVRLGRRDPSSPAKFSLGLLFVGLGFLLLVPGASIAADGVLVSPFWLVGTYFLHTVGELCLSPVGLSAMTRLAPSRIMGLMMGVWFLSISVGNYLGGRVASLYEAFSLPSLFGVVAATGIASAAALALAIRPIRRMLERKDERALQP